MTADDRALRQEMARLVGDAWQALAKVQRFWEESSLPGDFSTPDTGYPFATSLDETVAAIQGWKEELERMNDDCRHVWIAGMMYVADEDAAQVAKTQRVTCEKCDHVFNPATDDIYA